MLDQSRCFKRIIENMQCCDELLISKGNEQNWKSISQNQDYNRLSSDYVSLT